MKGTNFQSYCDFQTDENFTNVLWSETFNSVEDMSKFWEGCLFNTSIPALVAGCLSKREHDQQLKEIERQRFASIPTNNKREALSFPPVTILYTET